MAAKKCWKHPGQDAIALCYQCHRPVCNACIVVSEFGNFCSPECSHKYKAFKMKFQTGAVKFRKQGALKTFFILVIVAILILGFIHYLVEYKDIKALAPPPIWY